MAQSATSMHRRVTFEKMENIAVTIHVCSANSGYEIQAAVLNVLGEDQCVLHTNFSQCCASVNCLVQPNIVLACSSCEDLSQISCLPSSARVAVVASRLSAEAVKKAFAIPNVLAVVNGFGGENEFVAHRILKLFVTSNTAKASAISILGTNAKLQEFVLENSSDRNTILKQIEELIEANLSLDRTDASKIYAQRSISVLDEVMLNAIFGANPELTNVDRTLSWPLIGKAQVMVNYAFHENTIVIGVQDNFGRLEKPSIVKHVCDDFSGGITHRRSGGLGTRLAYDGSTSML